MTKDKIIFWDFDGTLVSMPGLNSSALLAVLDECEPGHCIDREQIRPYLKGGFPWHNPEKPHLHLATPDAWWANLEIVFVRAFQGVGFELNRARELAKQVRKHIIDPRRYVVYDDTIPVLESLKTRGWRQVILSNHIPELPDIIEALGLSTYIDFCITSAISGYEKPNPEAFKKALKLTGNPDRLWMIGDNPVADIQGAEAMGIPAILVRKPNTEKIKYYAPDLYGIIKIIGANE